MCYDSVTVETSTDYVCPACGERTLYPRGASGRASVRDVERCRAVARALQHPGIELDETQFCKKCSPAVTMPALTLLVHHEGKREPHRAIKITHEDLEIIREFLAGQDKHDCGMGAEAPLKDYLGRLHQLLGV